jgi:hypothetical protein
MALTLSFWRHFVAMSGNERRKYYQGKYQEKSEKRSK